jgi:glycerol kinase
MAPAAFCCSTPATTVVSHQGLLTTVGYQVSGEKPVYCLEGSIAISGALIQWLRDNLGIIDSAPQVEALARSVEDNGGAVIVPAFSGSFRSPLALGRPGVIVGLTRYVNKGHLARAVLEASAYQTREIVEAMNRDSGVDLRQLKVDGGMAANDLFLQMQADILDVPVIRPQVIETTALGAAYAAGLAVGYWSGMEELRENWKEDHTWQAQWDDARRAEGYRLWRKAVRRTLDWTE